MRLTVEDLPEARRIPGMAGQATVEPAWAPVTAPQRLGEMIYACPTFHRAVEDALTDLAQAE
jgi:hypothetical protein